jgi:hypothetical protein
VAKARRVSWRRVSLAFEEDIKSCRRDMIADCLQTEEVTWTLSWMLRCAGELVLESNKGKSNRARVAPAQFGSNMKPHHMSNTRNHITNMKATFFSQTREPRFSTKQRRSNPPTLALPDLPSPSTTPSSSRHAPHLMYFSARKRMPLPK